MKDNQQRRGWNLLLAMLLASLACSPLARLPQLSPDEGEAQELQVTQTRLSILESFPVQVQLSIEGQLPNSCTVIASVESQRIDSTFQVQIETDQIEPDCGGGPVPFSEQIQLDVFGLPAGEYQVVVDGVSQTFSLQTDNVLPTDQPQDQSRLDIGQGVRLVVPGPIGGQAAVETVPSQAAPDDPMPFNNYPDRRKITFSNYPLADTFHKARVELFPLQQTIQMNERAANTIAELRALLANPPSDLPEPLPFLPIFNAGPMVQAQEMIISNDNVAGVRFLTQFGQALYPVNNQDLFYTFQGLTTDDSYYVLAVFPVNHPGLPATGDDYLGMDPQEFFENSESYFVEIEAFLNEQAGDGFLPSLPALDELIRSLQVE